MNEQTKKLIHLGNLRQKAHEQLHGQRASASAEAHATAAMGVLHAMAASPATAEHALAVLHELQVHQIEIDMQAEELRNALTEADGALARQVAYLDSLPVACLTLSTEGDLIEINETAEHWLGAPREALLGQPVAAFMSPADASQLQHQLSQVDAGQRPGSWPMTVLTEGKPPRTVLASVNAARHQPGHNILVLMAQPR